MNYPATKAIFELTDVEKRELLAWCATHPKPRWNPGPLPAVRDRIYAGQPVCTEEFRGVGPFGEDAGGHVMCLQPLDADGRCDRAAGHHSEYVLWNLQQRVRFGDDWDYAITWGPCDHSFDTRWGPSSFCVHCRTYVR